MPLPKTCKMPDLSPLTEKKAVGSYLLSSLVGSNSNLGPNFILYRKLFVRLADKAIYEYSIVREAVIDQINDKDGGIYIVPIINHLENCINALRRLFCLFKYIKSVKQNYFFIDRNLRRSIDIKFHQIKGLRNLIEHMDEKILKGGIKKGQTIALDISEDASEIMIGDIRLSTTDLSNLIKSFYAIAQDLAVYNAPGVSEEAFKAIKPKKKGRRIN